MEPEQTVHHCLVVSDNGKEIHLYCNDGMTATEWVDHVQEADGVHGAWASATDGRNKALVSIAKYGTQINFVCAFVTMQWDKEVYVRHTLDDGLMLLAVVNIT